MECDFYTVCVDKVQVAKDVCLEYALLFIKSIMQEYFSEPNITISIIRHDKEHDIVMCKDCKHCFVDGDGARFNVCELNHNKVQPGNWFCADGERKENK